MNIRQLQRDEIQVYCEMHINIFNQLRYVTYNVSKMGANVNNLKFDNSSTREELYKQQAFFMESQYCSCGFST